MNRRRTITADRARRIVVLSEACDALPELLRASMLNKPRDRADGDRLRVVVEVAAVSESGAEIYADVELDMATGRLVIAEARRIITSELKALRTAP